MSKFVEAVKLLEECVDSLEYVNKNHPVTGSGVRAERILKVGEFIASFEDDRLELEEHYEDLERLEMQDAIRLALGPVLRRSGLVITDQGKMEEWLKQLFTLRMPWPGHVVLSDLESGEEFAPFLSESYLYTLFPKTDARTLKAICERVANAAGFDYQATVRWQDEKKDES